MTDAAKTAPRAKPWPGELFKPRRIGHVNYWVDDLESVAAFYRDIVGIEEVYRRESIKAIFMSNGNTYHDVAFMDLSSPRGAGKSPGLHHFSLELGCEKDLVDGFMACREIGFEFDFTISADVANSAYGRDPDGNLFEVYADVKPNWRAERSGAVSSGGRPWIPGETSPLAQSFYPTEPEIVSSPDAVFQPVRVSHAVLVTRNHEAMVRHYVEIAGLTPIAGNAEAPFVVLGGVVGEETLTLFRDQGTRTPGLHHTGLQLRDEAAMDASIAALHARGIQPLVEIDHPTRRALYVVDPAGQRLQFYVDRARDYGAWTALEGDAALLVA